MTTGKRLRMTGWASVGITLALGGASTGVAGAAQTSQAPSVSATFTDGCIAVDVSSTTHDLSNVVLDFGDGVHQRFEGLRSKTGSFAGTGANTGKTLEGVWVKAGANKSEDGPGYGERIDASGAACGAPVAPASDASDPDAAARPDAGPASPESRGGDAIVAASFECGSVVVTSTKELSNAVLVLSDASHVKVDGLSGHEQSLDAPAGQTIVAVYVKSGANHSGDGPGYGQRIESPIVCASAPASGGGTTGGSDGDSDIPGRNSTPTVLPTVVVPTVVLPHAAQAPEAAVLGPAAAGERVEERPSGAQVLGVKIERPAVIAAAETVAAPSALAVTGIDVSGLILVSGGLIGVGAVLVRLRRRTAPAVVATRAVG